jgi:hypothetical protein
MLALGHDPSYTQLETHTPAGVGNSACDAALRFRHGDGANQLGDLAPGAYADPTNYQPVNTPTQLNDPNRWQPLTVPNGQGGTVTQRFATPHWGQVAPFALRSIDQYPVRAPARAGSAESRAQADEVLALSAGLTDRQKTIVEYWADGPGSELPPGHWNLLAQFVSQRDGHRSTAMCRCSLPSTTR